MDAVYAHLRAYLTDVAALPGGELHDADGVLWCRTGIAWPMFNGMIAAPGAGAGDAARGLAAHGLPWFLWELPETSPEVVEAAKAAGAFRFDRSPWMEARIADLPDPVMPCGVTMVEVADEPGRRRWAAALREIYEFPPAGEEAWAQAAGPWRQWIAYADGTPAGVTLLYCGGGIAGLFGVGTKRELRRRGIGRVLTLLPLKESGGDVAGFFSSEEGEPLYRSLGFAERGWVGRWLGGVT